MKKLGLYIITALSLLSVISCNEDEGLVTYGGENKVLFPETAKELFVSDLVPYQDFDVDFGSIKEVDGDQTVEVAFDADKSTAIQGVDFDFISATGQILNGQSLGVYKLRVYGGTTITQDGKQAVFKILNSSLPNANFNQEMAVNFIKGCERDIPLKYNVEVYALGDQYTTHQQTFTKVEGKPATYQVQSSWGSFIADALGNPAYNGQYLYPGVLRINCDNSVVFTGTTGSMPGGTGSFDPSTGIISLTLSQSLLTSGGTSFTVDTYFIPIQ